MPAISGWVDQSVAEYVESAAQAEGVTKSKIVGRAIRRAMESGAFDVTGSPKAPEPEPDLNDEPDPPEMEEPTSSDLDEDVSSGGGVSDDHGDVPPAPDLERVASETQRQGDGPADGPGEPGAETDGPGEDAEPTDEQESGSSLFFW